MEEKNMEQGNATDKGTTFTEPMSPLNTERPPPMPALTEGGLKGFSARSGLDLSGLRDPLAPTQMVAATPLPQKRRTPQIQIRVMPLAALEEEPEVENRNDLLVRTILGVAMVAIFVGAMAGVIGSLIF
jgi:hypothetical protein